MHDCSSLSIPLSWDLRPVWLILEAEGVSHRQHSERPTQLWLSPPSQPLNIRVTSLGTNPHYGSDQQSPAGGKYQEPCLPEEQLPPLSGGMTEPPSPGPPEEKVIPPAGAGHVQPQRAAAAVVPGAGGGWH